MATERTTLPAGAMEPKGEGEGECGMGFVSGRSASRTKPPTSARFSVPN